MSEETSDQLPLESSPVPDSKPARKRATKTTAKKTVRKKATGEETPTASTESEPTAPKKRAVRKTAKPAEPPATPLEPSPKPGKAVTVPEPTPDRHEKPEAPNTAASPPESSEAPRFGRVPGGGPTQPREQPRQAPEETRNEADPGNESRNRRRRDKRKRRSDRRGFEQPGGPPNQQKRPPHHHEKFQRNNGGPNDGPSNQDAPAILSGPEVACDGMLELAPKGFGFLRVQEKNYEQARDDVFIAPDLIRRHNLRLGQWVHGVCQESNRGRQLVRITSINGMEPGEAAKLPHFEELKAINPNKRISFETEPNRFTTRVIDIMAPVGRGQRGLIVSPPRSGKTTLLLHIAEAIREKYDESIHLMVLLVDERPEEVTEFRRALPGAEIYASSNDEHARNHCRIAELAIERAKRLVEAGKDVFLVMDSITRLARAYNNSMSGGGGGGKFRNRATGSGGIMIGALEVPRRLFAAARNTRGGGSLTILATALIQTNSRADEAIFMEFKGTGNMELVLDRKIAENYFYPAVDIFKSGTRREELLLPEHMLHKIHLIRRGLSGHRPVEAMERLLFFLKKFPNNPQMLLEIKG
ncbi:MAG: transcription termination factor Rho [Verrucomicrobiota bacterium]